MSKLNHKEQIRVKYVLCADKLEELGYTEFVNFVTNTVCAEASKGTDSHELFYMFGMSSKKFYLKDKPKNKEKENE